MGNRKPQVRISTLSRCLMLSLAVMAGGMVPLTDTCAQSPPPAANAIDFNIPAGELAAALDRFAEQSGLQVVSDQSLQGVKAPALRGRYTPEDALKRLLQGSEFGYERLNAQTLVLKKRLAPPRPEPHAGTHHAPATTQPAEPVAQDLEKVTVTGTRIRGGTTPSPVITIGSERIREEGFTDLGQVIRSIPQNFSGGQNPGVLMGNVIGAGLANQNTTGGSGLNLRGLGPDASLTLLNGRRMVYSGFSQAVDISAIPVEAVERIEIVADGASAIYGSDAVGGVANVILKRDFDGFALGSRYGTATDGGRTTREYTATAGGAWASGGLIATYKDVSTDPVYARQRDYTAHLAEPQMILPGGDLHSGLLSAHQSLGNAVELRLDALRTEREQLYYYYGSSPAFYNILTPETTTSLVSPSIEFSLPNDWTLSVAGIWGMDDLVNDHSMFTFATGEVTPFIHDCYCNESRTYEIGAEGPVFEMSGGDVRLAVGAGYRRNEFHVITSLPASSPNATQGDEDSRFAYAELFLPLVGAESGVAGVQRLELTAAVRGEDYDSFGSVSTPKLGVIYAPGSDFTLKASWGKSFKAPTLFQLFRPQLSQVSFASSFGGIDYPADATVLLAGGGNPDLTPERAQVWTASLAFHPEALPGLEAELTWFDIDYTDRVVESITTFSQALTNPAFAEFVQFSPTAEQQAAIIAATDIFFNTLGSGVDYDPSRVVAFIDARYFNAVRQQIKGLDLSASYRFDVGEGRLMIRGSASWLDSTQQSTATTFDLAGTLHNPVKLASRLGAVWNQGGFTASAFANYKSGVRNVVEDEKLASFTTIDVTLRYATGPRGGAWSGLEFALSAQNLFDRPPSLYTVSANRMFVPPYDSTNYSAIGRFVNLSVSKHW